MKGVSTAGSTIEFGDYALKASSQGWISSQQIESARKAITRYTKKGGRSYIRIFPDKPISKKPPETRMGSGKGDFFKWVAPVRAGRVMFEIGGVTEAEAREALTRAKHKLSVKTIIVKK
jgi:large subunit ribosomal protein L16